MGAFSLSERRLELLPFANDIPAPPRGGAGFPTLHDGFVLGLTDATPDGVNAAWRAALVARDRRAPLRLLCMPSVTCGGAPVQAAVHDLASRIRQRLHVPASATCVPGVLREQLAAQSGHARLLLRRADAPGVRRQRNHGARRAGSALEAIIRQAGAHGGGAAARLSIRHVASRVLAMARAGNAQLIVVGKQRRALLAKRLLPGVIERVLLGAATDVLVLPISAHETALGVGVPQGGC